MIDRDHRPSSSPKATDRGSGTPREAVESLTDEARSHHTWASVTTFVVGVALAVATAVLVAQNGRSVTVEWFGWDPTGPTWLVLAFAFVAGLLATPLVWAASVVVRRQASNRTMRIDELSRRPHQPSLQA